jgi:4-hydroxy-tetrahydrodipicolinate synthase
VRHNLTGPIPSVRTPFAADGSVDYEGLRRQIDVCIDGGARTVLLTAGDSHYVCLSEAEIRQVTKVTAEHTGDRAMVVAADRQYATGQAVEFAAYARDAGADVVMCLPPDWSASCTADTLADHYAAVAEQAPVMLVTTPFQSREVEFGLRAVDLALQRSDDIVAVKDDVGGEFARRLGLLAHDRCALFSGGRLVHHMNMYPYGCDGFMTGFAIYRPEIAHRYWDAVRDGDLDAARAVIRDYDVPLHEALCSATGGRDAGVHGLLEILGIAGRHRREPYHTIDRDELEEIEGRLRTENVV